jgi:hypothetical protein
MLGSPPPFPLEEKNADGRLHVHLHALQLPAGSRETPGQQELQTGYPTRSIRWSFSGFTSRLPPKSVRCRPTPLAYPFLHF